MPQPWSFDYTTAPAGRWRIVVTAPGGKPTDVTDFRGAPTRIDNYSFTDPFADSLAQITFPQITGFDDLAGPDVGGWFTDESDVDIYWVPAIAGSEIVDPVTGTLTRAYGTPVVVWEGIVASFDFEGSKDGSSLVVQCQGALLQLDRYLAKPAFPPRPLTYESMMVKEFSPQRRPNLRTKPLLVRFPDGWAKKMPAGTPNMYTPLGAAVGESITGYSSRDTGTWDRSLTGFMQSLLAVMFTQEDCGVTPGNQWSIRKEAGRQPVLEVRDRFRVPDFEVWYGQIGVLLPQLTHDSTQKANVYYGEGVSLDGTNWRNAVISDDGSNTDYAPLAWSPAVYPTTDNTDFDKTRMVYESYQRFGSGFDQSAAIYTSRKQLARDLDPGWVGSMTLRIDPSDTLSRWQVRAGMTVLIKGFAGSGETGIAFHIAEAVCNPEEGSVTLKIDTKYRDLLTLEEVVARTRDPLTPSKQLQVNRRQVLVEDIIAPWDYTAGSGYLPKASVTLFRHNAVSHVYPWASLTRSYPPKHYPQYYVRVKGQAPSANGRWAIFPVLTSQKGTIRRTEIHAFDIDGNPLAARFHLSLYYTNITVSAMPMSGGQHSPFFPGAFETTQPNGQPWPAGNFFAPDPAIIIGWGNADQPAGYSPGSYAGNNPLTGSLVDEASWSFDNINNPNFNKNSRPGQKLPVSAITVYAALYTDYPGNVYFLGRLYRQEPGT